VAALADGLAAVQDFLAAGGAVLVAIGVVLFVMWTLILERYWYLWTRHSSEVAEVVDRWSTRGDKRSWHAAQIRRGLIAEIRTKVSHSVGMINTLVAICPLMGLLGTVTGMIEVFDVMAITGSSNARAMASGVTKATIPTMAGMVAALSGLYFSFALQKTAEREVERTADLLVQR
jgi:biopolymer transport protein ExbB